ncbi:hypothetical protein [Chryseobacterium sp. OV279]|uniref:hypothetical protein n=1 Tax=Chryseobacterium sp. OV279 TaxID=1500285 RepID=UPI00091D77D2|nr:hypothetical protein [Chryseobacterium sp. OV279]SHF78797.1 hypothetical protein SAMN02787100_2593 [Chryseobacterium sp. OV279]
MKRFFLSLIILSFISCNKSISEPNNKRIETDVDYYERCRLLTLEQNTPNQDFGFIKKGKEIDEQVVKYLGSIITSKNDTLKILNSIHYTGIYQDSKRGNGQVYIYNSHNKLLGFYNLGSASAVPSSIDNKELIFKYNNENCNQTTKISLKDSIPNQIFVHCTKDGGDVYSLERANN